MSRSTSSSVMSRAAILAQWEQADNPTAPITSKQRDSVLEISEKASKRPIPPEVLALGSEMTQSVSSTGNIGLGICESVLELTSQEGNSFKGGEGAKSTSSAHSEAPQHSLYPAVKRLEKGGKKIESGHQFLEWLHQVENDLQFEEDAPYRFYIDQLEGHRHDADEMLQQVEKGLSQLKKLHDQHYFVSTKSNSLHTACQHLLQEQNDLVSKSERIMNQLTFFTEADKINQELQSATFSVKSDSFLRVLDKIYENLLHVLDHPTYKQSNVYRVKYNACLSRALGMIRSYFKSTMENATMTAMPGQNMTQGNTAESTFPLFYGKFRAQAPRVAPLIAAIEKKISDSKVAKISSDIKGAESFNNETYLWHEYESVLNDCQHVYFGCRSQLLMPSVKSAISDLATRYKRDHCGLIRSGCALLLHICEDEFNLFHQFFQQDSDQWSNFVEGLCQILYDTLRPLVIHLNHLETLSELTGILRSEMIGHYCASHPPQLAPFEKIITQLLQDVKERLVYRAYIYIRTDILGYSPALGDLAYPEKLEMMESIAESLQTKASSNLGQHQRQNSTSSLISATSLEVAQINGAKNSHASNSPADLHGMWYPPVRRTLVCLSKLYRCLEREIFQGLSQEALSACMDSIANAADMITARQKNPTDGQLFQIKHLLILREQIAPFHVDFSVREMSVDFSKIKTAAISLLSKRGEFLNWNSSNAILEFLLEGTPEVKEHCRDSRKEVDRQLKTVCEKFIASATSGIVAPMEVFLSRVEAHRKHDNSLNISRESWATPTTLNDIIGQCQRSLKKTFPLIQRAMQLYLSNKETEFILFRPIRNNVMTSFISFLQLTRQNYNQDEQIIIACPTQEQIAMMNTSLQLTPKTPRTSVSKDGHTVSPTKEVSQANATVLTEAVVVVNGSEEKTNNS